MIFDFLTCSQRDNPYSGYTPRRSTRSIQLQGRWQLEFLGIRKALFLGTIAERSHHQWWVLCQISEALTKCYHEETPRKTEECSFFFHEKNSPPLLSLGFNGCCVLLRNWTSCPPLLFSWFDDHLSHNMKINT